MASGVSTEVGIKVTADTRAAQGAFKQLADAERRAGDAGGFITGIGKALDGLVMPVMKAQVALLGVRSAIESFQIAAEAIQWATNAVGITSETVARQAAEAAAHIKELNEAGAKSKIIFASFEAGELTRNLRLTASDFELIKTAAYTAAESGLGEYQKNMEAIVKALNSGDSEALRELGINMNFTGDRTRDASAAMDALRDQMKRLWDEPGTKAANFRAVADALKGQGDEALATAKAFGEYAASLARVGGAWKVLFGENGMRQVAVQPSTGVAGSGWATAPREMVISAYQAAVGMGMTPDPALKERYLKETKPKGGGSGAAGGMTPDQRGRLLASVTRATTWRFGAPMPTDAEIYGDIGQYLDQDALAAVSERGAIDAELLGLAQSAAGGGDAANVPVEAYSPEADKQKKLDGILAKLQDSTSMAGAGYGALSSGIAAAVDAAISGSDSIGKALAKAAAASLKATAVEASVKALWETAQGVAHAAIGSPGAAAHFKAAALFAATAAAAGAGSAGLSSLAGGNGGGGSSASAGAAGGGYIGQRGSGGGGDSVTIVVQGDVYGGGAELAEKVDRAYRTAKRSGRVSSSGSIVLRD